MTDFVFEKHKTLSFNEFDMYKRLKVSTTMKYIADIAGVDFTRKGLSHDYLWEKGMVFLLSRVAIKNHRIPKDNEKLLFTTYENGTKGVLFNRNFIIYGEDGIPTISAKTCWVLCEPATRKIIRPKDFTLKEINELPNLPIDCPDAGKIQLPSLAYAGERKIVFSDIDYNGHVYNAAYADIACDILPSKLLEKPIQEFSINFSHEAKLGEHMKLYTYAEGKQAYVQGKLEKQTSFECRFLF